MKKFTIFLTLFFIFSNIISAQKILQPDKKYHLIRLDDMGMCHSVNMAVEKAIQSGLQISTSVMFACPWYQEAIEILKKYPDVSVGVHLTLNAEWKNYRWGPVTGREAVPSLVDSCGFFFPSRATFFANNPQIDEVEKELRAQVERAITSGLKIDYVDYHMGTAVQTEEMRQLVEQLAAEYKLGIAQYFNEQYSNVTYFAQVDSKDDSLAAAVDKMGPGVNLQVVHVGLDTPEMRALKDLNPFGLADMSKQREGELTSLLSENFRVALKENKMESITYRDLINMVGLQNMKRPEKIN